MRSWQSAASGSGFGGEIAPEDADPLDDHRNVGIDSFADGVGAGRSRRGIDEQLIEALQPMLQRKLPSADAEEIEDKAITLYQGVVRSAQTGQLPRQTLQMLADLVEIDPDELLEQLSAES